MTIVIIEDKLLFGNEWQGTEGLRLDVLLVPIGGLKVLNTVDDMKGLEIMKMMAPDPSCYNKPRYHVPTIFSSNGRETI